MKTKFIEVVGWVGEGADREPYNHGKFMVGAFEPEDYTYRSRVEGTPLVGQRWDRRIRLVLDLETGEGALFSPNGWPVADLKKHPIRVCPLYPPFLHWLYTQDTTDLDALPDRVDLDQGDGGYEPALWRDRPEPETATG